MFKSGFFLFLGLLVGRALGLVREILIAGKVGTGSVADIVIALVTLPDIVIGILLGNSLTAVFTPTIQSLPKEKRFGYFLKLSTTVGFIFVVLALLLTLQLDGLATVILTHGRDNPIFMSELKWVVWATPILALNSVSRVFLQAENRFSLLSFENVVFNICIILGVLYFSINSDFHVIALAVLAGSLARWFFQFLQIWLIYNRNLSGYHETLHVSHLHRYNLALITGVMIQMLPLYGRSISSSFGGAGALSIYNYAYKFIEFPIALGISVISTLIFPKLSALAVAQDKQSHRQLVEKYQNFMFALCMPLTLLVPSLLLRLAEHSISLKQIPAEDLSKILYLVLIGFLAFVIRGLNEVYVITMNSLGDVKHPMQSTLLSSLVALVTIYYFTKFFGIEGSFWGLNLSFLLTFALNAYFIKKRHQVEILTSLFKTNNKRVFISSVIVSVLFYLLSATQSSLITVVSWVIATTAFYLVLFGQDLIRLRIKR